MEDNVNVAHCTVSFVSHVILCSKWREAVGAACFHGGAALLLERVPTCQMSMAIQPVRRGASLAQMRRDPD